MAIGILVIGGAQPKRPPTFYQDVLPILAHRCQACHRPGEVAPMSLLTYEQVRPWADGQAKLLKAGSDIVVQFHYTTNGTPTTDQTRLGLTFARKPPTSIAPSIRMEDGTRCCACSNIISTGNSIIIWRSR